ncbi:MAG: hypothetical protein R3282_03485 [Rhodothermales bacterium]|nr:hypothetical protein [Rhodothermales bacterium]
MRRSVKVLALFAALALTAGSAQAQLASASHNVTITVTSIDDISVSGDLTMTINSITLSSTASATYDVTTNGALRKITAALDANYSLGLALSATVAAPSGSGVSTGPVLLTTVTQDVVTGISTVSESGLAIDYTATATPAVGPISETRQVTYTITT